MGLRNWETYHYKVFMIENDFPLVRRVKQSCGIARQFSAMELKDGSLSY